MKRSPIDPELLRSRLAEAQGKTYWRCLDELADDPAFKEMVEREFPDRAGEWGDSLSRRRFLTLMGAGLALAGLAGCRPPSGRIMPYVRQPENLTLGKPLFYATAMTLGGFAAGLLVESHEGRPTKLEGNPQHPASLGATSPLHQASILDLYDPDRSQTVRFRGQPRSWTDILSVLRGRLTSRARGARVAVLSETVGSPALQAAHDRFRQAYPDAIWARHEPISSAAAAGAALAFGRPYHSYADLTSAEVIVSLDCDFLTFGPAHLANARQFSQRRREGRGGNRLYVVETDLTVTGANADNRLAVKPSEVDTFARALAHRLGVPGAPGVNAGDTLDRWARAIAADLRGKPSAVLAGEGRAAAVHAIAFAINHHLGNVGRSLFFPDAPPAPSTTLEELNQSIEQGRIDTLVILGGNPAYTAPANVRVAALLRDKLRDDASWLAVHLGPYFDETARLCHWHIPEAHYLETWGDARAFDGTPSICQPLISPLYDGKSALEIVAALTPAGEPGNFDDRSALDLLRGHWRDNMPPQQAGKTFEQFWQETLHDGVMKTFRGGRDELVRWETRTPALTAGLFARPELAAPTRAAASESEVEVLLAPDPAVYDGRFANNGWLQEWPRPITRITWDNVVLMSPETARRLRLTTTAARVGGEHGRMIADRVLLRLNDANLPSGVSPRSLTAAAWVVPGHADGAVTVYLGYGRTHAGRVGTGVGESAYALRYTTAPWLVGTARVTKAQGTHQVACVQAHHNMEGRDPVRSGTVTEYRNDPAFALAGTATLRRDAAVHLRRDSAGRVVEIDRRRELPTLFRNAEGGDAHVYTGYKWGMAVDLSACTGCGACVVACQAENNSPVVGKEQVTRGREMHWLRIDLYYATPSNDRENFSKAQVLFQPVMCQHCEHAPCEPVCPVAATAHSDEGLNDMVYNRCVGTRYCANNCPYKVRRFNFLQFSDYDTPSRRLGYNPDVTVRSRGVMEKCTFCVQRIAAARIEAAKEQIDDLALPANQRRRVDDNGEDGRPRQMEGRDIAIIRDGEVLTACQAACPAEAIVFGDLNDRRSKARRLHDLSLRYDLLGELGTRPRVYYLAKVRNPNPALEA